MSGEHTERPGRFTRRPRAADGDAQAAVSRSNFGESLDAIETFLHHATEAGREGFSRNSPAYASGSMAVIRTAALFETDEFVPYLGDTPHEVVRAIITTRNIAAHSGYRSMNDEILWNTLTVHLPPYIHAWRAAAGGGKATPG